MNLSKQKEEANEKELWLELQELNNNFAKIKEQKI